MIIAGVAKDLRAAVHAQSGSAQVATGTMYCVAQLESTDADDGKYWDTDSGGSWQASPVAWPEGTHTQAGVWSYELPAAATTGKAGATISYTFTDDLTEASATTVCGGGEHRINAEDPLATTDIPAAGPNAATIADTVWDEVLTGATHNVPTSAGRRMRQLGGAFSATVTDASPTASAFVTDLTSAVDDWYSDVTIFFTSGALEGLTRIVSGYVGSTKQIQLDEPLPAAPANGDVFDLTQSHAHSKSQIAEAVMDQMQTDLATELGYLDAAVSSRATPADVAAVWDEQTVDHTDAGSFGAYQAYLTDPDYYGDISTAVLGGLLAGVTTPGSLSAAITDILARDYDYIASAVLDDNLSLYLGVGTVGKAIYDASLGGDTEAIGAAVAAVIQGADGDTLETLSDQIDTLAPVSGAAVISITVQLRDGDGAGVPFAQVSVFDETDVTHITTVRTDASGNIALQLPEAGTYAFRCALVSYAFSLTTHAVAEGDTVSIVAAELALTPAPDAEYCRIQTIAPLRDIAGNVLDGYAVKFRAAVPSVAQGGAVTGDEVSATTDDDGNFYVDLLRGASVAIIAHRAGYNGSSYLAVPDSPTQDFATWE